MLTRVNGFNNLLRHAQFGIQRNSLTHRTQLPQRALYSLFPLRFTPTPLLTAFAPLFLRTPWRVIASDLDLADCTLAPISFQQTRSSFASDVRSNELALWLFSAIYKGSTLHEPFSQDSWKKASRVQEEGLPTSSD